MLSLLCPLGQVQLVASFLLPPVSLLRNDQNFYILNFLPQCELMKIFYHQNISYHLASISGVKGLFTNTCKGGPDAKKIVIAKFFGTPFQTSKNFRASFFAMKITGQPHRKACKLNFYSKICGIFFQGPTLQRSTTLRAPFLHQTPLSSVCELSLSIRLTLKWPGFFL